jgi:hypothetical protein
MSSSRQSRAGPELFHSLAGDGNAIDGGVAACMSIRRVGSSPDLIFGANCPSSGPNSSGHSTRHAGR